MNQGHREHSLLEEVIGSSRGGTSTKRIARALLVVGISTVFTACATMGVHVPSVRDSEDFGKQQTVDICVYKEESVSRERVESLMEAVQAEFSQYGIEFNLIFKESQWDREGFVYTAIARRIVAIKLEKPCDRQVFFIGRHLGDHLFGFFGSLIGLPEVFGVVDFATSTVSYVVANRSLSLNHVFVGPGRVTRHEFYHLFGCRHDATMEACYRQIALIKKRAALYEAHGNDFFPGFSHHTKKFIYTRYEVNMVREEMAKRLTPKRGNPPQGQKSKRRHR